DDEDGAAAVNREKKRGPGQHQRVFKAGLVPEIAADPPAFVIGHDEKDHDRAGDEASEQPEREHWTADELRDGDRGRPEFSGTIAVAVELPRQLGQTVRLHPGRWHQPERLPEPMRHGGDAHHRAEQRPGPWGERLRERAKLREDERRRVSHLPVKGYSPTLPRLMLAPRRASRDFLLRPFAD